jgi:hypothetical protein
VEKAMKSLAWNEINSDLNEWRDMALYHLKATGEFDAAVCEWEQKPTAKKTWPNIKTFISIEYARENRQNKLTAKQFSANAIQEQAEAAEELIASLMEAHTRQMEYLFRSTTEAMKEMMLLLKENKNSNINVTNEEDYKKRQEKQKKYNNAPICKNCGKKHPSKAENKCWELEKNKDSCPSTWKSNKNNWQGKVSKVESETWQPGVIHNKINEHHTYLDATNYWTPLNNDNDKNEEDEEKLNTLDSKTAITKPTSNKRMRRLARKREHKLTIDSGATSNIVCKRTRLTKRWSIQ